MKLSFHGADRGVTGSCHLVESHGCRILIDCGLYQGGRELREENADDFGFEPKDIDYLLLTHSHLDHCGRIPLLEQRGFKGEIVTTPASRELARLVMLDAAHLQEEEAHRASRHKHRHGHRKAEKPLYTVLDALNAMGRFGRAARYGKPLDLAPGVRVTFIDAGHILGSACILLELEENGKTRTVLYSGDLGNAERPFLRSPTQRPDADVVVMETTYGDRLHEKLDPSVRQLYEALNAAFGRGGNVIVPTFALERAQELLWYLRDGVAKGILPPTMQVFLDSPMAISATQIFEKHPECYDEDTAELFREGRDPFDLPGLHFVRETADSIALNRISSGAVILAGSGMCTGGRVRHHLRHNLWREESSVVFVGFAARGTLARRLVDGADEVKIFGEKIHVRAGISSISGFSAHADRDELLTWHGQARQPEKTFLVHGEEESMEHFAGKLGNIPVERPKLGEEFAL